MACAQSSQRRPLQLSSDNVCPRALGKMEQDPERYSFYELKHGTDAKGLSLYPSPYAEKDAQAREPKPLPLTLRAPGQDNARAAAMSVPMESKPECGDLAAI